MFGTHKKSTAGFPPPRIVLTALAVFLFVTGSCCSPGSARTGRCSPVLPRMVSYLAARAGGEGHEKPFWYYASLLGGGWFREASCWRWPRWDWLAGFAKSFQPAETRPARSVFFSGGLCAGHSVIYSVIPYKTPWLALNFWLPLTLSPVWVQNGFGKERERCAGGSGSPPSRWESCWVATPGIAPLPVRRMKKIRMPMLTPRMICCGLPARVEELARQNKLSDSEHRRGRGRCLAVAVVSAQIFAGRILAAGTGNRRGGFFHHHAGRDPVRWRTG